MQLTKSRKNWTHNIVRKENKKRLVTASLFLLVLTSAGAVAQTRSDKGFITTYETSVGSDHMLDALHIYEKLLDSRNFFHIAQSFGVQTTPEGGDFYDWAYNYPSYGLTLGYYNSGSMKFKNGSRLADFFNLNGYLRGDFLSAPGFSAGPYVFAGFSYTSGKWDPVTNPANTFVGSNILGYLGVGLEASCRISPRMELGARLSVSHRSNGMLRVPNHGVNELEGSLFLRAYQHQYDRGERGQKPSFEFKKWTTDLYITGGVHSCDVERHIEDDLRPEGTPQVRVGQWKRAGLGIVESYRYTPVFSTGVGLDLFYTENWKRLEELSTIKGDPQKCCPLYVGICIQQTVKYRNIEASVGVGAYLFKRLGVEDSKWNYQRILLRYHFDDLAGMFLGFGFRAHSFDRSDTWEFMIGKRF